MAKTLIFLATIGFLFNSTPTIAEAFDIVCTDPAGRSSLWSVDTAKRTVHFGTVMADWASIEPGTIMFKIGPWSHVINRNTGLMTVTCTRSECGKDGDSFQMTCEPAKPKF